MDWTLAEYAALIALPMDGILLTAAPLSWLRGYERFLAARGVTVGVYAGERPAAYWLARAPGYPTVLVAPPGVDVKRIVALPPFA